MKKIVKDAQEALHMIRVGMNLGNFTYEQAKEKAEPYLKVINNEAAIVAKRFGRKPFVITFTAIMR